MQLLTNLPVAVTNLSKDAEVGGDHDDERKADAEQDDDDCVGNGRRPSNRTDRFVADECISRPADYRREGAHHREQPDTCEMYVQIML